MGRRQAKKNNVLVAGSAGFIGSRVCQYLLEAGWNVLGLDNLNDYYDPLLKKWRLQTLKKYPGFTFSKTDIVNLKSLEKHFYA
ncbi:MAG: NAD-dependent epimerase/dehydratase family protein, partial [Candidatus Margulisbacteria bacterium]|nr:NAD-dependent epimerase/dehydratase family protein [Candidatus Margulisiibacteriota bacterium]